MPRGRFADELKQKIGPLTSGLLVPLYFVYSGLNTRIGLVDSPALWGLTLVILLAACAGKGLGCFTAAKLSGEPTRDAVAIGALMNARGLMELVLLNIVYERGLITQTLFSIMVIMAVVTTLMATPLLELALRRGSTGAVPRS
jgi:Kef-type K+ transport system membrane component KefB